MKVKVEIDCTPEEARTFLGLPDVTVLNDHMVTEMTKRMDANMAMMKPEEIMKAWTGFGLNAQEQFRQMMTAAAGAGLGGGLGGFGGSKPGGG